ncbi:iroquois protein [Danaus plexippus plexippus]|uniref:Iroquois protein n=1 Tax=Danaus plexippus plexippus TaxID=278856 RepID=A0A212EMP8_DANPL|nr:iroquois protein [Danaus plexippus plexippus]
MYANNLRVPHWLIVKQLSRVELNSATLQPIHYANTLVICQAIHKGHLLLFSNPYALKEGGGEMSAWTSAGLQPSGGYYPYDPTLAAYGLRRGYKHTHTLYVWQCVSAARNK